MGEAPGGYCEHDEKVQELAHSDTGLQTSPSARWKARVLVKQRVKGRRDVQARLARTQKAAKDQVGLDDHATKEVVMATHSYTARSSIGARLTWWEARTKVRGIQPYPLDKHKLQLAAAILKKGGYRTADQYLYCIKKQHVLLGHEWSPQLSAILADLRRSCKRGLGPAIQAAPLVRGAGPSAFHHRKIRGMEGAVTVGCAWLLRDIEMAALQVEDIKFTAGQDCGEATLRIWSSKTDSAAQGVDRTLPCLCPNPWCPVKAVRNLTLGLPKSQQILRTWSGEPVTKRMFVDALKEYASLTGT